MTNGLLAIVAMLFVCGFTYGLLLGNPQMHPFKRAIYGGLFFAFFFVAIPVAVLQDRNQRR